MLRHNSLGGPVSFLILGFALALTLGAAATAEAQCGIGTPVGNECVVDTEITVTGQVNFTLPLHILNGGEIKPLNQSGFTLNIDTATPGDDFIMESGSVVGGTLTFGTCTGGQQGAPITIQINGGNGIIKEGALVQSKSNCPAGWIQILTSGAGTIDIDGTVESVSTGGGAGPRPGGGPITIIAGCELTIEDDGVVSSRGRDPGADLVHLEGCKVVVNGLVESTGTGHGFATQPPNSCADVAPAPGFVRRNPAVRPGHPNTPDDNSVACVEIWGNTIEINSQGTNRGEINVDVSFSGGRSGRGWVEIFARNLISILDGTGNDTPNPNDPDPSIPPPSAFTPPIAAIHANAGFPVTNARAGFIDIVSIAGNIVGEGFVAEASSVSNQSNGGFINLNAFGALTLTAATLEAQGDSNPTGQFGSGGHMTFQAFTGPLNWPSGVGNVQPTGAGIPNAADRGTITFFDCGVVNVGATFPSTGAATTPSTVACGLAPALPPYVVLPAANCQDQCALIGCKEGVKFSDLDNDGFRDPGEPGLVNWQIVAFSGGPPGTLVASTLTDAQGAYRICLPPGTYTFCEVLKPNFVQTFPVAGPVDVVSCAGFGPPSPLGALGYRETLVAGQTFSNNDFGNRPPDQPPPPDDCPEDPDAVLTHIVDNIPPIQAGAFATIQAAYNAAPAGSVIGVFANTNENIVMDLPKSLTITQCTVAQVTAANSGLPVWHIGPNSGALTIIGLDTVGGTVGWKIEGNNHKVSGVRASLASQIGIQVIGSNNDVSFNTVEMNAVGVQIEGSANKVGGDDVQSNSSNGVVITATGTGNTFQNATVKSNGDNGVLVEGSLNTVKNVKAARDNNTGNGETGIAVIGSNNLLDSNETNDNGLYGIHVGPNATGTQLKSNKSNRGTTGGVKENALAEYKLEVAASGTGNQADNVNIPQANKCPTFPGIGECE